MVVVVDDDEVLSLVDADSSEDRVLKLGTLLFCELSPNLRVDRAIGVLEFDMKLGPTRPNVTSKSLSFP